MVLLNEGESLTTDKAGRKGHEQQFYSYSA